MTTVVAFNKAPTLESALKVIDRLREDLINGTIIGFACAALDPADEVLAYISTVRPIPILRMQGATAYLLFQMQMGEIV